MYSDRRRTLQGTLKHPLTTPRLQLTIIQQGKGLIKVNGKPLSLTQPEILRFKVSLQPSPARFPPTKLTCQTSGLRTSPHRRP